MASVLWVKRLGAGGSDVRSLHGVNPAIVTLRPQRGEEYPRSPKGLPCPGNPCFLSNSASAFQVLFPYFFPQRARHGKECYLLSNNIVV